MESDRLYIYTVYANPSDYPGLFVARRSWRDSEMEYHDKEPIIVSPDYDKVKKKLRSMGLVWLDRMMGEDPVIKETWI